MSIQTHEGKCPWFFDAEIYPNYVLFSFKAHITGERRRFRIYHHGDIVINEYALLLAFVHNRVSILIGYNNKAYDNRLLSKLLIASGIFLKSTPNLICGEIYELNEQIINRNNQFDIADKDTKHFKSVDVILLFNRIDRISLKQLAVNMRWPKIQDLPIPPGSIIMPDQLDAIEEYCDNDVDITEYALTKHLSNVFGERLKIFKTQGHNIVNMCDTDISKFILKNEYCKATGIPFSKIKNLRTVYKSLNLFKDCISPKVRTTSKEGVYLLKKLSETTLDMRAIENEEKNKKAFSHKFYSKFVAHQLGLGGMHSINKPGIIVADDYYSLEDIDVRSYYPKLLINEGLFPAHLGPIFNTVYEHEIVAQRFKALRAGNDTVAYFLKIAANSVFGLTKSKHSWMYDPRVGLYICMTGQLYLLMLIEALEKYSDCIVIYSNTDGLTVRVPRHQYNLFKELCERWEYYTKLELEYNSYSKMYIRDVNNYLIETTNPNPAKRWKAKGVFVPYRPINKGYHAPVIAKSLFEYFANNISVHETIRSNNDIYDFLFTQKADKDKFIIGLRDSSGQIKKLQQTNRWVMTRNNPYEGLLLKMNIHTRDTEKLAGGLPVTILNNIDSTKRFEDYRINYQYYDNAAAEIAYSIKELNINRELEQPKATQLSLFN